MELNEVIQIAVRKGLQKMLKRFKSMGEILIKSNVHLLGIPGKLECENNNIENSGQNSP